MKLPQIFLTGSGDKTTTVSDAIFGGNINLDLLAQAVYVYRSNERSAHAKTQTRSEVDRTKSKWYKQKGTGRARHGARTAHIFVGGGVVHGPTGIENYKKTLPQRMRTAALQSALAAQAQEKKAVIAQGAEKLSGQTKELMSLLPQLIEQAEDKVLVIIGAESKNFLQAARNIPQLSLTRATRVNAWEVAKADKVVVLQEALETLEQRLHAATPRKAEADKIAAPAETKTAKTPVKRTRRTTKTTEESK